MCWDAEQPHESTDLSWGAVEFLQAVLQPLHFSGQVFALEGQEVAVELDLLQEGLGRGVVVAPLVDQVVLGGLVHADVHVGHELADRFLHGGLQLQKETNMPAFSLKRMRLAYYSVWCRPPHSSITLKIRKSGCLAQSSMESLLAWVKHRENPFMQHVWTPVCGSERMQSLNEHLFEKTSTRLGAY